MSDFQHVTQPVAPVPVSVKTSGTANTGAPHLRIGELHSEFTIVAVVRDRHAGERTFTADELRSALVDCLSDLHLQVKGIKVLTPTYAQASSVCGDECSCPSLTSSVCGDECSCPSLTGGAHAPTK